MLDKETKSKIIGNFKLNEKDTGSVEVQVAMLTERIRSLAEHLKQNPKDMGSKCGLMKMISQRRSFFKYIEKRDPGKYKELVSKLELRK